MVVSLFVFHLTMEREFDIVIFGASGFVGKYAIIDLCFAAEREGIKWAVAGRSQRKLKEALLFASKKLNYDITGSVPIIEADVDNYDSLIRMAQRTTVVANCVGPYTCYGEPVVKACIESSTHHLDVTGEVNWVGEMQLKYHKRAEETGSLIVPHCAFECIPSEMAAVWMKKKFEQSGNTLNAIEVFMHLRPGPSGLRFNHGSWDSFLQAIGNWWRIWSLERKVHKQLYPKPLPKFKHTTESHCLPFTWTHTEGINFPAPDVDTTVSKKSNAYLYNFKKERPIYLTKYATIDNWWVILLMAIWVVTVGPLVLCSLGRKLLMAYPRVLSFGLFSKEGPSEKQIDEASFECIIRATGWKGKKLSPDEEPSTPPDHQVIGCIMGPELAYPGTSQCLIQSAITIVKERGKIDVKGGVVTPRVVFGDTSLVDRLSNTERNAIKFNFLRHS